MNENQNPVRLLNGQYVLLTLINFVVSVSYSMVSTIMAKYLGSIGLSIAVAGAITGAFSIASMVARPFTVVCCWPYVFCTACSLPFPAQ